MRITFLEKQIARKMVLNLLRKGPTLVCVLGQMNRSFTFI